MLAAVRSFQKDGKTADRLWWVFSAVVVASATVFLAFNSGGFFAGATSLAAAEMALLVVLRLAIARRPFEGGSIPLLIAVLGVGAFAAWALASAGWSDSTARALPEYTRALLYVATLGLFGLLPFHPQRVRLMIYTLAAAFVSVCAFAIVARTLPEVILDPALKGGERLGYPLTYWNALGLMAAVGIVLCGHLACSTRDPGPVRVLGAASIPLLTLTLYYTLSRGGTWAAVAGVVLYVVLGRPRALLTGAIATAPPALVILLVANPANALTDHRLLHPTAIASGKHVATVLIACMAGAAVVRAILLPLDGAMDRFRLPDRIRRPALSAIVVALMSALIVGGMAVQVPQFVSAKYQEFTDNGDKSPSGGGNRLVSASTNGRQEHWDVAFAAYRRDHLHGSGAGTFGILWAKEREGSVHVQDAHSLYIETLGELGLVGLALLVVALLSILAAFAYRARGPDRAMFAALLAAGVGWAGAAGVDWDWEMPAVTLWLFAFGGAALARSRREGAERRMGSVWALVARVGAVVACLAVAIVPARLAISAAHYEDAVHKFKAGNCPAAKRDASDSLSAVGQRAAPYSVIGYCDIEERRYRQALHAMQDARERDPHNWEIFYNLAVAQAAAGQDPRGSARRAALLNPNDKIAASAPARFRLERKNEWKQVAMEAPLMPPSPGDP